MKLPAAFGDAKSGSLTLAAIASVFTIRYVANLLSEDEDWLHQLSIDMFPERQSELNQIYRETGGSPSVPIALMGVGTAALLARLSAGGWHPGAGRKGACIG